MKRVLITALAGLAISLSAAAQADGHALKGDPVAGKAKSATCVACHGADGNSSNPEWPKLAGQGEGYLLKQLMNFKADKDSPDHRSNASMNGMVMPLSEQDMADLAAYYAGQEAAAGEADESLVALGRMIYKGGNSDSGVTACAACHGPTGIGNPAAKYPMLAGQHAKYTEMQLKAFAAGERANDPAQMMRNIAAKMTAAEMKAVSEYAAGLQQ